MFSGLSLEWWWYCCMTKRISRNHGTWKITEKTANLWNSFTDFHLVKWNIASMTSSKPAYGYAKRFNQLWHLLHYYFYAFESFIKARLRSAFHWWIVLIHFDGVMDREWLTLFVFMHKNQPIHWHLLVDAHVFILNNFFIICTNLP